MHLFSIKVYFFLLGTSHPLAEKQGLHIFFSYYEFVLALTSEEHSDFFELWNWKAPKMNQLQDFILDRQRKGGPDNVYNQLRITKVGQEIRPTRLNYIKFYLENGFSFLILLWAYLHSYEEVKSLVRKLPPHYIN